MTPIQHPSTGLLMAVWLPLQLSALSAGAQTPPSPAPATQAAPAAYRSAFEGYQAYRDEKIANWKEANDNVGRIGGWRAYAKEASQPPAPSTATQPVPHAGHAKP